MTETQLKVLYDGDHKPKFLRGNNQPELLCFYFWFLMTGTTHISPYKA